jgi:hypothetical protein
MRRDVQAKVAAPALLLSRLRHALHPGASGARTQEVDRPPYTHLVREVATLGYLATGRRYGVSDNAIRKWLRQYEREHERQSQASQLPLVD